MSNDIRPVSDSRTPNDSGAAPEPSNTFPVVEGVMHGIAPLQIALHPRPLIADFSTRFFSVGSCFADHVSAALSRLGFPAYFDMAVGNHFSTRSLAPLLARWAHRRSYQADELYHYAGTDAYLSPFHKNLTARGPGARTRLLAEMEARDAAARTALADADIVFLTLGSATYLQLRDSGNTLAFSASVPRTDFQRLTLSVADLRADLEQIYDLFQRLVRRKFHLVLTVSPQRYNWPPIDARQTNRLPDSQPSRDLDPITYSNLDKAKLRAAIDEFVLARGGDDIEYFPSFDIVMDELRMHETFSNDYRDRLHVGFPATSNYVINRFLLSHCTPAVITALQDFRRGFLSFERHLRFDHSPKEQARSLEFLRTMRAHRDRVGCDQLYDRVRTTIRRFQAEALPSPDGAVAPLPPPTVDDDCFAVIRRALRRFDDQVALWISAGKRVAVYGAGRHTSMLLQTTALAKANLIAIADDFPEVDVLAGVPVVACDRLKDLGADVVVLSSASFQERMRQRLAPLREANTSLYAVYDAHELPDVQRLMLAFEQALR